ncbi:MAG: MBL fold metallo-hydrolase [Clostridiales bacterium]|nr:MBL fold metallo-hydrolase [Clostridiales bacterium]
MEKVERIQCGNGNCYIVSNGENAILVDTCREKYREKILKACRPYHMRLLLLTHGHIDHVQNAAFLSKELQIPIAMCKADLDLLNDNMSQSLKAKSILGKIVLSASMKSFREEEIPLFNPSIFLSEGDSLYTYGISAKILSVPGHTNGSIAIDVDEKYLIVGDALMNMFYPTVSMLYHDKTAMLESAKRISKIGSRTIYFGHGKSLNNRILVKG